MLFDRLTSRSEGRKSGAGHSPTADSKQAILLYQVDNGPMVATSATKLSFHGLEPGRHMIVALLAAPDLKPIGRRQSLNVQIPEGAAAKYKRQQPETGSLTPPGARTR